MTMMIPLTISHTTIAISFGPDAIACDPDHGLIVAASEDITASQDAMGFSPLVT